MKKLTTTLFVASLSLLSFAQGRPVLKYDFATSTEQTVKDISGNGLNGSLQGKAQLVQVDNKTVVDLGNEGGYIDMGTQIGQLLQKSRAFTVAVKYLVREEASLKGNGYFLWAFSTQELNTKTEGRYHAYKLNIQRSENSIGGWTRETLMDIGKPSDKGSWQHAVYTQDGQIGRLYLNGNLVAFNNEMFDMATTFPDEAPRFNWLGRAPFPGDAFLGGTLIADVRVYRNALSESEVRSLSENLLRAETPKKEFEHADFLFSPKAKQQSPSAIPVALTDTFSLERGYGFDFLPCPKRDAQQPFYFSVLVPNGNYKVTITYGSERRAANTCLRAESRRLFLPATTTRKGELKEYTCIINKRDIYYGEGEKVRIKPREKTKLNLDDKLTIEVTGEAPSITRIQIDKVDDIPTVFLCGNSTVVDQDNEPWASWGQMIPSFFDDGICFANHAESGESALSFIGERRLAKLLYEMKAGDYVFVEFGHNDQKQMAAGQGPYYSFASALKTFVDEVRSRQGHIVFVTPTQRRNFDAEGKHIVESHGDFPEAMKWVAERENVPLLDLHQMTRVLFETLGAEGAKKALVHYPMGTFPDQTAPLADDTHFNTYGAYQVAKCVVEGMRLLNLPIISHLRPEYQSYSPAAPDNFETFSWNPSLFIEMAKPEGN